MNTELHERLQLSDILLNHVELLSLLQHIRAHAPWAYLSAGVIRNTLWSYLHAEIYALHGSEIDVIFFDATDQQDDRAQQLQQVLAKELPHYQWDVVNQALVHHWYRLPNGKPIPPYTSLSDAIACWPETATAIAVRLDATDQLEIIAPCGLQDLLQLKLRWNSRMVPRGVFLARVESKGFLQRWPKLQYIEE